MCGENVEKNIVYNFQTRSLFVACFFLLLCERIFKASTFKIRFFSVAWCGARKSAAWRLCNVQGWILQSFFLSVNTGNKTSRNSQRVARTHTTERFSPMLNFSNTLAILDGASTRKRVNLNFKVGVGAEAWRKICGNKFLESVSVLWKPQETD